MKASASSEKALQDASHNAEDEMDAAGKRRRVQRACDICRRKKIRCDGAQEDSGACSNCNNFGLECTFVDAAKKRTPPRSYVDALEARIEKLELLISQLAPGMDFTDRIGPPVTLENAKEGLEAERNSRDDAGCNPVGALGHESRSASTFENAGTSDDDSEREGVAYLINAISKAAIDQDNQEESPCPDSSNPSQRMFLVSSTHRDDRVLALGSSDSTYTFNTRQEPIKFFGNSSGVALVVLIQKMSATLDTMPAGKSEAINALERMLCFRGQEYDRLWMGRPKVLDPKMDLLWPEADLEEKLLDTYFTYVHPRCPVVNEFFFRDELRSRPELRQNVDWVCVALGIFCLASRHLSDPRLEKYSLKDGQCTEPGLRWYHIRTALGAHEVSETPNIYIVQSQLLSVGYLHGVPAGATISWAILGMAIKVLQGLGAHRRITAKRLKASLVIEETVRRAFWVAYDFDREQASGLGRPLMIQDEDFDVAEPLDIDDDVIYEASKNGTVPVQPDGRPSKFSAFITSLKLQTIVGRALRTIYAIGKAKAMRGFAGWKWDQFIVAELDSALNQWLDTVPEHLHFNPSESDETILMNSAWIYTQYYTAQILVHRPFIPDLKSTSPLKFPSLAICTNAARSAGHIFDAIQMRNLVHLVDNRIFMRAFAASTVLLVMVFTSRSSCSAMTEVRKTIRFLKGSSNRRIFGGLMAQTLVHLADLAEARFKEAKEQGKRPKKRQHADATGKPEHSRQNSNYHDESPTDSPKYATPYQGSTPSSNTSQISSQPLENLPLSTYELAAAFQTKSSGGHESNASSLAAHAFADLTFANPFAGGGPYSATESIAPVASQFDTSSVTGPFGPNTTNNASNFQMSDLKSESQRRLSAFAIDPTKAPSVAMSAFFGANAFPGFDRTLNADAGPQIPSFPFMTTPQFQSTDSTLPFGINSENVLNPSLLDGSPNAGATEDTLNDPFNGLFVQGQLWGEFGSSGATFFQ
ncbi:hypothetical protein K437DRAFT_34553 [Tilletiaria anomala UBC 951]|uniref:Zn(2)-C6 fungal-type domain-containing protein n=1 Tax=Tilletiaria anomala (strain ATCC 24038 / CBS 436.72 / UBC 951) TaxID=1037660 RepID=A0A066WEI9_TILAU|nr:uncharacterized protein K437DRAFT_34553 [Tilletiaria anomala UBC 951]KDN52186.1 hypothetical protein K437DRAFT_34553 [Tilletiaria anomala UBC 951]